MTLGEAIGSALPGSGHVAVVVRRGGGEPVEIEAGRTFPSASLIKLSILAAALELEVPPDARLPVRPAAGGSGVLAHLSDVPDLTVRDLLTLMIVVSDNTATNVLIDHLGMAAVNRLSPPATTLARRMMDAEARARGEENLTTAADVADVLADLARSPFALAALHAQQFNDRLPRHLPPGFRLAHKTGELAGISHDAGIVHPPDGDPVVLAVLTQDVPAPENLIAEIGRLVYATLT